MTTEFEEFVGKRLRRRRRLLSLTQKQVADAIGIKFQLIQRHEYGLSRIPAARLWKLSKVLSVPITYFTDGFEDDTVQPILEGPSGAELRTSQPDPGLLLEGTGGTPILDQA